MPVCLSLEDISALVILHFILYELSLKKSGNGFICDFFRLEVY